MKPDFLLVNRVEFHVGLEDGLGFGTFVFGIFEGSSTDDQGISMKFNILFYTHKAETYLGTFLDLTKNLFSFTLSITIASLSIKSLGKD